MQLSVIVPVYNECDTVAELLRRVLAVEVEKQVIVVDDGSSDGTAEWLTSWARGRSEQIVICQHAQNRGKGAAVRTGLVEVTGEYVLIQDGDLEYNPEDYVRLLEPLTEGRTKVVYGSRFLGGAPRMFFTQRMSNVFLTRLTNLLYGASLTDMETCYKLFTSDVVTGITLVSNRFDVEPELTAKVLRAGLEIEEVPITYAGRSYREGKKINWRDFVSAVWTLVRFRL